MFKWLLPNQKGTELWPQVTRQPTKVRIEGVEPGSDLALTVVNVFRAEINHFHRSQHQNYALGTADITKRRRFYPIGNSSTGTGEVFQTMVPGLMHEEASSNGLSNGQQPGLAMTYSNQFGHERIDIVVTGKLLEELKERKMIRPERDIELRGYICIHNANIAGSVQAASEADQQWELRINGTPVGGARNYADGQAVVFCIDGYRPHYHSVNNGTNPFGNAGQPAPPHPEQEHSIQVQYPFFGINDDNPVMASFLGSDIVDQDIILDTIASPITYIDVASDGLIDLFGLNEAEVFQVEPPPEVEATSYALIYSEFFGRYAREVEVGWRFPYEQIGGVARKILVNDDPVFRGSRFGAPALASGYIGGIRLDLRPPDFYADGGPESAQGGVLNESLIGPDYSSKTSRVEGYPFSLFEPWP